MLASGTRLGPYEIGAPLGAGGMGEVYRARDTRLSREVAVKVLPQHLSREPEVRARFEREARAISSLNHPHICVLHDVGRDGDTDYLVMELVEGETLSARLAKGALPLAEVVRLGAQVAEALARAHRAGVVHRDLKPGNIMVTKAGAKLMDFGLARTSPLAFAHREDATQAPTEPSPITAEGRIVGTVQYMAPEQFEGREADARSDIWALGCVLYEMATGTRAFGGASTASVMSAILRDEPAPMTARAPASPPALERLIRSCLAKDPHERWQSAGDLARELEWLAEGGGVAGQAILSRDGVRPWLLLSLFVLAAVAGALQLTGRAPWSATPPRRTWTTLEVPGGVIGAEMTHGSYAISPDGSMLALVLPDSSGSPRLFVRSFAAPELLQLAQDEQASQPFWSPDSREIGFINAEGKLERVGANGGAPQVICEGGPWTTAASWGRGGWIVFDNGDQGPLMKVRASGGTPEMATVLDSARHESGHILPEFLPDGRHFMFLVLPPVSPAHLMVRVGSLDGTSSHALMVARSIPQSDGRGRIVFMREHVLYRQGIDDHGDRLRGEAVALKAVPARQRLYQGAPVARVGGDRLIFLPADDRPTDFVWIRRDGLRLERVAQLNGHFIVPSLSPDGHHVVVRHSEGAEVALWLLDLASGAYGRLTDPDEWNTWSQWSASGLRISYVTERAGKLQCMLMDPEKPESTRVVATGAIAACFVPGDRQVVLERETTISQSSGNSDLIVHDIDRSTPDRPYAASPANELDCELFDGGRRAAFVSDASGRWEVYCDEFPIRRHTVRLTYDGCARSHPSFRCFWVVGKELFYMTANSRSLRCVPLRREGADVVPGSARTLFDLPTGMLGIAPSPDGQRFLVALPAGGFRPVSLTFVDHWDAPPSAR